MIFIMIFLISKSDLFCLFSKMEHFHRIKIMRPSKLIYTAVCQIMYESYDLDRILDILQTELNELMMNNKIIIIQILILFVAVKMMICFIPKYSRLLF